MANMCCVHQFTTLVIAVKSHELGNLIHIIVCIVSSGLPSFISSKSWITSWSFGVTLKNRRIITASRNDLEQWEIRIGRLIIISSAHLFRSAQPLSNRISSLWCGERESHRPQVATTSPQRAPASPLGTPGTPLGGPGDRRGSSNDTSRRAMWLPRLPQTPPLVWDLLSLSLSWAWWAAQPFCNLRHGGMLQYLRLHPSVNLIIVGERIWF